MMTFLKQNKSYLRFSLIILSIVGSLYVGIHSYKVQKVASLLNEIKSQNYTDAQVTLKTLSNSQLIGLDNEKVDVINNLLTVFENFSKMKSAQSISDYVQTLQFLRSLKAQISNKLEIVSLWEGIDTRWGALKETMITIKNDMNDFENKKLIPAQLEEQNRRVQADRLRPMILNDFSKKK